jgi:hypothetical protein
LPRLAARVTEASPRRRDRIRRRHSLASGQRIVTRVLPFLVEPVGDRTIPDASLSPLERAVRAWREEILEDLGGDTVSAAKRAVLDAAVGSKIVLSSLDNFLYQLANTGQGLVNRRGTLTDTRPWMSTRSGGSSVAGAGTTAGSSRSPASSASDSGPRGAGGASWSRSEGRDDFSQ